ncbi:hypothetical protein DFH09DRAFT_374784 [Mycena vulgaris]|nr:hypothetical protein DFH09DRAFT_374784 [Mycena vulgaris]
MALSRVRLPAHSLFAGVLAWARHLVQIVILDEAVITSSAAVVWTSLPTRMASVTAVPAAAPATVVSGPATVQQAAASPAPVALTLAPTAPTAGPVPTPTPSTPPRSRQGGLFSPGNGVGGSPATPGGFNPSFALGSACAAPIRTTGGAALFATLTNSATTINPVAAVAVFNSDDGGLALGAPFEGGDATELGSKRPATGEVDSDARKSAKAALAVETNGGPAVARGPSQA